MTKLKKCPDATGVYLSGPELKGAWRLKEERQLSSLSWAVRLLVREGLKSLGRSPPLQGKDEEKMMEEPGSAFVFGLGCEREPAEATSYPPSGWHCHRLPSSLTF